jgi:hypothetical protein
MGVKHDPCFFSYIKASFRRNQMEKNVFFIPKFNEMGIILHNINPSQSIVRYHYICKPMQGVETGWQKAELQK